MTFYELLGLNELLAINIYKSNINILLLKTTKCQEQTVIKAIDAIVKRAGEQFHDKSAEEE